MTDTLTSKRFDAYGAGCAAGANAARQWLAHPLRGDSAAGGTLQQEVLELAARFASARGKASKARARGEIVGFCYAVECQAHSALLNGGAK